jgi:hypothetical protein
MPQLDQPAVQLLWPVLQVLGLAVVLVGALVSGLWVGFKWLHKQIESTSKAIVKPVEERVALVEKAVDAAHRRIDEWLGAKK